MQSNRQNNRVLRKKCPPRNNMETKLKVPNVGTMCKKISWIHESSQLILSLSLLWAIYAILRRRKKIQFYRFTDSDTNTFLNSRYFVSENPSTNCSKHGGSGLWKYPTRLWLWLRRRRASAIGHKVVFQQRAKSFLHMGSWKNVSATNYRQAPMN